MTAPVLARTGSDGYRYYEWAEQWHPSVTSILSALNKNGLAKAATRAAGQYAVANLDQLAALPARHAVDEIAHAPWAAWDARAALGTAVHTAVEARITGRPAPPLEPAVAAQAAGYLDAFARFEADHRPRWIESEATVFNTRHGYAGTLDAIAELRGTVTVLDFKTGRRVYPDVALQLAAYANSEFIGEATGAARPLPTVQAGAVLHLRPKGYHLRPVTIGPDALEAFGHARGLWEWTTKGSAGVLGAPRQPVYGTVYLLHLDRPVAHARHYLGWTSNLTRRLAEHAAGRGSPLLEAAARAGIGHRLVRTWEGVTRLWERILHDWGITPKLCPVCEPLQAARRALAPVGQATAPPALFPAAEVV